MMADHSANTEHANMQPDAVAAYDKVRLAADFGEAAATYDAFAPAQAYVARHVGAAVQDFVAQLDAPVCGLEIGCGTGLLSQHLPFAQGSWLLSDISAPMLAACAQRIGTHQSNVQYVQADGEHAAFPARYDVIASSLALQWFHNLRAGIHHLQKALTPRGRLIIATLGQQTFWEWNHILVQAGVSRLPSPYPTAEQLQAWFPDGRVKEFFVPVSYPQALAFHKAVKAIGAGQPRPGYQPLAPGMLRRALALAPQPFVASYHILRLDLSANTPMS
jgi:malonyl-CoA O-methyltransferase